MVQEANIRK